MIEVYTGERRGRPVLAMALTGLLLAGAVGVAAMQVQRKRAMQPGVPIPRTPLNVRPPIGWQQHPRRPWQFVLPASEEWQRRNIPYTKTLVFEWRHLPGMKPPTPGPHEVFAKIAGLPGVQRQGGEDVSLPVIRRRVEAEALVREAVSPEGDVIIIRLVSIAGLTMGDYDLMDAVADAVKLGPMNPPAPDAEEGSQPLVLWPSETLVGVIR